MRTESSGKYSVESVLRVFILVTLALLAWSWWVNFTAVPFFLDSGYYLSAAERIHEGWRPYRDFHVSYTPVGMYYFSLFSGLPIDGQISYRAGLLLVQAVSAVLLYVLSGGLIRSGTVRIAGAASYV